MTVLWVALGSAIGGGARYGVGALVVGMGGISSVWATLIVNVTGSFAIGTLTSAGLMAKFSGLSTQDARAFLMVGMCGGFTTFSAFSMETLELFRRSGLLAASANIAFSVTLCLVAIWLGQQFQEAVWPTGRR